MQLAIDFPGDFGPECIQEPGRELKDIKIWKVTSTRRTEKIRGREAKNQTRYQRINLEKVNSVRARQDYHNAVNKGTRSGSGKVVQDDIIMINYDLLTDIRGASPSTTSLLFGIDSETAGT